MKIFSRENSSNTLVNTLYNSGRTFCHRFPVAVGGIPWKNRTTIRICLPWPLKRIARGYSLTSRHIRIVRVNYHVSETYPSVSSSLSEGQRTERFECDRGSTQIIFHDGDLAAGIFNGGSH
jgi:hypothetical protein